MNLMNIRGCYFNKFRVIPSTVPSQNRPFKVKIHHKLIPVFAYREKTSVASWMLNAGKELNLSLYTSWHLFPLMPHTK